MLPVRPREALRGLDVMFGPQEIRLRAAADERARHDKARVGRDAPGRLELLADQNLKLVQQ